MIYYDINIDKLEVTFERNGTLINKLSNVKVDGDLRATDKKTGTKFLLHRLQMRRAYPYCFSVCYDDNGEWKELGTLYTGWDFNPNRNKIYLSVSNEALYTNGFKARTESLQNALKLQYYQVSKLDLALDCDKDLTKELYRIIRQECLIINGKPFKYDVIVNGKKVGMKDRLESLSFLCTGTRKNPIRDKTLYIQNKKMTIGVRGYDKGKEIEESSHKEYQRAYGESNKLYRIEVELRNANEINNTVMESLTAFNEITTYWICREQIWDNIDDKDLLEQMFFLVLNRLLYFTSSAHRAKKKINAVEFAFDTLESRAHPPRKGRKAHTAEPTTAVPTITEPTTKQTINKQSDTEPTTAEPVQSVYVHTQPLPTDTEPLPSVAPCTQNAVPVTHRPSVLEDQLI